MDIIDNDGIRLLLKQSLFEDSVFGLEAVDKLLDSSNKLSRVSSDYLFTFFDSPNEPDFIDLLHVGREIVGFDDFGLIEDNFDVIRLEIPQGQIIRESLKDDDISCLKSKEKLITMINKYWFKVSNEFGIEREFTLRFRPELEDDVGQLKAYIEFYYNPFNGGAL